MLSSSVETTGEITLPLDSWQLRYSGRLRAYLVPGAVLPTLNLAFPPALRLEQYNTTLYHIKITVPTPSTT